MSATAQTPPRRRWSSTEDATIKRLAEDLTSAELADLLGRTPDAIKHRAKRLRVSLRKYGQACSWAKYPNLMVEAAREMHDAGKGPRVISQELGVPYWAVCDWVYYKRGLGHSTTA
jgi:hypothetical protein